MPDTHAPICWVKDDANLPPAARQAIKSTLQSGGPGLVSAITAWEIAVLVERGRLSRALSIDDWLLAVSSIECVEIVTVSHSVAVQSTRLPGEFHNDPTDRMIVALARERNAILVTADEKIHRDPHVRFAW